VPFYDMDVQMTLFRWVDGVDLSIFEQPVGLAEYVHSVRKLTWDIDYTEALRPQVAKVMDLYERRCERHATPESREARGPIGARRVRSRYLRWSLSPMKRYAVSLIVAFACSTGFGQLEKLMVGASSPMRPRGRPSSMRS
jgi:hypothetical protein